MKRSEAAGPNRLYHVFVTLCVSKVDVVTGGPSDPFTQQSGIECEGYFNSRTFDIDSRVGYKWHAETGLPLCLLCVLLQ